MSKTKTMRLTAENVNSTFLDCLYIENEPTEGHVPVKGIIGNVGFHPGRLEKNRPFIASMLSDLPKSFMQDGGDSFLNACMTSEDKQWGEHEHMDKLFMLGTAIGIAKLVAPRALWDSLPGGMPYYFVDLADADQATPENEVSTQQPVVTDMGNDHYVISFPDPEKPFIVDAKAFRDLHIEIRLPFLFDVIDVHECPLGSPDKYICQLKTPGKVEPNLNYALKPALLYQLLQSEVNHTEARFKIGNLTKRIEELEAKLASKES